MVQESDEETERIEADLREISAKISPTKPGPWIMCNIVVIEDMESRPWGTNAEFLAIPRVGEGVSGFGVVEEVSHGPALTGDSSRPTPYVTLFVRRGVQDAHRT
jgi:hypothetical protein